MADRVSWLMIRAGWKVYASDGSQIGEVDEVTGDDNADIFDGLSVATSALGKPRYVPAEQVVEIYEGAVHLTLTPEQAESLSEYREPATSAQIEADNKAGGFGAGIAAEARELEGRAFAPVEHERSTNIWRRVYRFFRRSFS